MPHFTNSCSEPYIVIDFSYDIGSKFADLMPQICLKLTAFSIHLLRPKIRSRLVQERSALLIASQQFADQIQEHESS
jgi:hypothetical protein